MCVGVSVCRCARMSFDMRMFALKARTSFRVSQFSLNGIENVLEDNLHNSTRRMNGAPEKDNANEKEEKKKSKTKSSTLSRKEKENAREHIPNLRQHVPFPLNYFTLHFVSFSKRPKIQRIVTSKRLNISYFLSLHRFASIHYCTLIHFRPTTKIGFDAFAYVTMHQTTCRLLFCCEFISTMQRLSTVCSQFLGCASKRLRMSISVTLLQNSFVEFVMKSEK